MESIEFFWSSNSHADKRRSVTTYWLDYPLIYSKLKNNFLEIEVGTARPLIVNPVARINNAEKGFQFDARLVALKANTIGASNAPSNHKLRWKHQFQNPPKREICWKKTSEKAKEKYR